ncbi:MAG TPA: AAA family ATPase [Dietzia timorensis]|uniref:AAA family ATPase n=1 Tax=Dietzia timorensis TaxID=499555 RepID=A0A921F3G1_9ACTN|nr:ArsA-related P-loop ATPase [Dietzia timorensis]HJE90961.1 AAA family ATPase [Dietzia timorensis]
MSHEAASAPTLADDLRGRFSAASAAAQIHFVSGKGGTGKTTVAAALALSLASEGNRVLLVEVEERQGIARLFDRGPLPYKEVHLASPEGGGEVHALAIETEAAMLEYMAMFYRLGTLGKAMRATGAIEFATSIAPGIKDVILTGKIKETATRDEAKGEDTYDAIVVDSPPTGRIHRFLDVTVAMAGLARGGPIHAQANDVARLLHSRRTVVHLVTLLESLPVQETLDAIAEIESVGISVGHVIVNRANPKFVEPEDLPRFAADGPDPRQLADGLSTAGIVSGTSAEYSEDERALVEGLIVESMEHARVAQGQIAAAESLSEAGAKTLVLPHLPGGIDTSSLFELAAVLNDQGVTRSREGAGK